MKRIISVGIVLLLSAQLFGQLYNKGDISFELRYPIPVGDNFLNKGFGDGYVGYIDAGIDYSAFRIHNFGVGIVLNLSELKFKETATFLLLVSPKIKFDYYVNFTEKIGIIPQVALGYSLYHFYNNSDYSNKYNYNG